MIINAGTISFDSNEIYSYELMESALVFRFVKGDAYIIFTYDDSISLSILEHLLHSENQGAEQVSIIISD